MKFPNWFKVVWWLILLILSTTFLIFRIDDLLGAKVSILDFIVFVFWSFLTLFPIISEINIFGVKLKKELENFKDDINSTFVKFYNEIKNKIEVQTNFNPNITLTPVPSESLSELQEEVKLIKNEFSSKHIFEELEVSDTITLLFKVRYVIENQLRRIKSEVIIDELVRDDIFYDSLTYLLKTLLKSDLVEKNIYKLLREILAICNYGIHGKEVSDEQINLVRTSAPYILSVLKNIK